MFGPTRLLLDPAPTDPSGGAPAAAPAPTTTTDAAPSTLGGGGQSYQRQPSEGLDWSDSAGSGAGNAGGGGVDATVRTPADPNAAAGVRRPQPAQGQPAAQDWQSIRDAAQSLGYRFDPAIADDQAALVHLIQQAQNNRQADYYAQLGRQILPHAPAIQGFLQQKSAPAQPAAPERQPWEPPPFDPRWANLVTRDETTGLFLAKPGAPPEVAERVNEYVAWKEEFDRDPASVLDQMVNARFDTMFQERIEQRFQQESRQRTIQDIAQRNTPWLYQKDAQGRPLRNASGQPVPSQAGVMYINHLRTLESSGVTDPRVQDQLAQRLARADLLAHQHAQGAAGQAPAPQTQQAGFRPNQNPLQAGDPQSRRQNPAATEPSSAGQSLREMLAEALRSGGVTDADFNID